MDPSTAPALAAGTPVWAQLLYSVVTLVVMAVLVPFLNSRRKAADAEAASHQIDTSLSLLSQRDAIVSQLKAYVLDQASSMAERYFPQLAADIAAGKLKSADDIKRTLHAWGTELYDDAVAHFKGQGIDLVERFGPSFINDTIEWAANKVSPFPGKETTVALLNGGAQALLQYGIRSADVMMTPPPAATAVPLGPPSPAGQGILGGAIETKS